jgi:hypothetical protein
MQQEVKTLINDIAKELDLNILDVEKAFNAPFELQSIIMKYRCDRDKQYFPSLRIPYFLIFYCPDWNKKRLKKIQDKKNEAIRNSQQQTDDIRRSVSSESI